MSAKKVLLSANEAVARGAAQAGCIVASAYPGTPSTEILENIAKFKDTVKCEWAVNEKVAMETAIGASMAGARANLAMLRLSCSFCEECMPGSSATHTTMPPVAPT